MNPMFKTYDRTCHAIYKSKFEKKFKEVLKSRYKKINFI